MPGVESAEAWLHAVVCWGTCDTGVFVPLADCAYGCGLNSAFCVPPLCLSAASSYPGRACDLPLVS